MPSLEAFEAKAQNVLPFQSSSDPAGIHQGAEREEEAPILPEFNMVLVGAQDSKLPWLYPIRQPLWSRVFEMTRAWDKDGGHSVAAWSPVSR